MDSIPLPLLGSSGTVHGFELSRWSAAHAETPAVYALLSHHGRAEPGASTGTVLYVGETENLDAALSTHRDYPCMQTFVDAVGSLPAASVAERVEIQRDVVSLHRPPCDGCWPPTPAGPEGTAPYPDRVVGGCLAELALLDLRLEQAVRGRRVIRFVHGHRHCQAEPHAYGVQADGQTVLVAYQTGHGAGGGGLAPWKTFPLSEIHALVITDRPCGGARPGVESPIAVIFAQGEGFALKTAAARVQADSPDALKELHRQVEGTVQQLRTQVLELRRTEAECARIEYGLERPGAPAALVSALAAVREEQSRAKKELLAVIPEVAALQRGLPKSP